MASLPPTAIYSYATHAGFTSTEAVTITAIAYAESSGDPTKTHKNSDGSIDYGLTQINSVHTDLLGRGNWQDPQTNMNMAHDVFVAAGRSFKPWSTFTSGSYKQYISMASVSGVAGGDAAVSFARAQIGKPYVYGGTGPNGYDCSGLTQAAWHAAGVAIGRTTYEQVTQGTAVTRIDLAPGDLVFPDADHVQIYSGNGKVIEAQHTGTNVLEGPMWGFWTARRVGSPGTGNTQLDGGLTNGGGTGTVLDSIASFLGGSGMGSIVKSFEAFGFIAEHLADPHFWARIGQFVGGLILVIMAVDLMKNQSVANTTGAAGGTVKSMAAKAAEVAVVA